MGVPHIGCTSHKLNLEVKTMVEENVSLKTTIDEVHQTMLDCRQKLKTRAMLRNITDLSPIIHNATRWSGKYLMFRRYDRIREKINHIATREKATLSIVQTNDLYTRADRFANMLQQVNQVTIELQNRKNTLSDCRFALDTLIESVELYKNNVSSPLYMCSLGTKYIDTEADISLNPVFESGVVKIQRNEFNLMTDAEKDACSKLILERSVLPDANPTASDHGTSMYQRIQMKKRRRIETESTYRNCDFILGSVAEVERLWSVCNALLSDNRKRMSPLVFESIVFLKENRSYWSQSIISKAIEAHRNGELSRLLAEDNEHPTSG